MTTVPSEEVMIAVLVTGNVVSEVRMTVELIVGESWEFDGEMEVD